MTSWRQTLSWSVEPLRHPWPVGTRVKTNRPLVFGVLQEGLPWVRLDEGAKGTITALPSEPVSMRHENCYRVDFDGQPSSNEYYPNDTSPTRGWWTHRETLDIDNE